MAGSSRKSEWIVFAGVALLVVGVWTLLDRVFGWAFYPLSVALHALGNVGWPLLAVGIGVLLIMKGRAGGWSTEGKLCRSRTDRKVAGVLGGAAEYFKVDASVLRLVYAVATVLTGFWFGFLVYAIAMLVIPEEQFAAATPDMAPPAPSVPASPAPPVPTPPTTPSAV